MTKTMRMMAATAVSMFLATSSPTQEQVVGLSHDLVAASDRAQQEGKDVLVACLDVERDSWSRKLRDRVLTQRAFQDGVGKNCELVMLDVRRDTAELARIGSPRAATCVLLSPDGDAYGQLRYRALGVRGYLDELDGLRVQRASVRKARTLVGVLERAQPENLSTSMQAALAALEVANASGGAPVVREILGLAMCRALQLPAIAANLAATPVVRRRAVRAVLSAGYSNVKVDALASRLDPENAAGLFELTLVPAFRVARDKDSVRIALACMDKVCKLGMRDHSRMKPLLVAAMRFAAGRLQDRKRAVGYADRLQPMLDPVVDRAELLLLAEVRQLPR